MRRTRNLLALLMAAMLSLGTMGIALADDGSGRVDLDRDSVTAVTSDAAN